MRRPHFKNTIISQFKVILYKSYTVANMTSVTEQLNTPKTYITLTNYHSNVLGLLDCFGYDKTQTAQLQQQ